MERELRLNLDLSTREAQRNVRDAEKAVRDLSEGFDDGRSKGDRLADAIRLMAQQAEAELLEARSAADKLAAALGDDLVAEVKQAGGSVDGLVQDLKRLGLTYDEISQDADALGSAIRDVRERGKELGVDLNDGATRAADGLDRVRDSGDQSRSVLANMVGNSAQDLGELGGVAGTAGVAIGQLAEYAVDGNIQLSSLAKFIGPMVGIGVAVAGISWAMGKLKESSEKAKAAAEGMLDVQKKLRDGNFEEAATKLQEEWGGTIGVLEQMGFTTEQVIGHLTGQRDITDELNAKVKAHRDTLADDIVAQEQYDQSMSKLRDNLGLATTAFEEQGKALDETTRQTNAIDSALKVVTSTTDDAARGFNRVDRAAEDYAEEAARAKRATQEMNDAYEALMGSLDDDEAWANVQEKMWAYHDAVANTDGEVRDYIRSLADMVMALDDVPEETKTNLIAQLQDGDIATVETYLNRWAQGVNVPVRFQGQGQVGFEKKASGGPVKAGVPYVVGDNPDGTMNATSEIFVPSTDGTILSASQSRAALGGGGDNVTVHQYFPPGVSPESVARATRDYRRRGGRS